MTPSHADTAHPSGEAAVHPSAHPSAHPAAHPSARLYVTVWAVLLALTVVTVGVTYLDMKRFAVFTALLIAATKAGLVALYFMHLRYEARIYSVLLMVALVTLAIFVALTFADIGFRYS